MTASATAPIRSVPLPPSTVKSIGARSQRISLYSCATSASGPPSSPLQARFRTGSCSGVARSSTKKTPLMLPCRMLPEMKSISATTRPETSTPSIRPRSIR